MISLNMNLIFEYVKSCETFRSIFNWFKILKKQRNGFTEKLLSLRLGLIVWFDIKEITTVKNLKNVTAAAAAA